MSMIPGTDNTKNKTASIYLSWAFNITQGIKRIISNNAIQK